MRVDTFRHLETGIGIVIDMPEEDGLQPDGKGLDPKVVDWVVNATRQEDMRAVTAEEVLSSFATFTAYVEDGSGLHIAGFLRQRAEDNVALPAGPFAFCPNELGTLLVAPEYRQRNLQVADTLVASATTLNTDPEMRADCRIHIPVAVCNLRGGKVFARWGYEEVGRLENGRSVRALPPAHALLRQMWTDGPLREAFIDRLGHVERFAGLTAVEVEVMNIDEAVA